MPFLGTRRRGGHFKGEGEREGEREGEGREGIG